MIKTITCYTLLCDNCGIDVNEGTDYSGCGDEDLIYDIAFDSGWIKYDDKWYCPDCADFDNQGNLMLRTERSKK